MGGAQPGVVSGDQLIMETNDESLLRRLHGMRAARSVLEHDGGRWIVTRISANSAAPANAPSWLVYGTRARRGR